MLLRSFTHHMGRAGLGERPVTMAQDRSRHPCSHRRCHGPFDGARTLPAPTLPLAAPSQDVEVDREDDDAAGDEDLPFLGHTDEP
jgi:hypothetical protein